MKKYQFYLLIFLFTTNAAFGQKFDAQSSNFLELGSLSSSAESAEGVSEATGAVSLQFPLFTLKQDGFTLPVSLSYQSNGFKVDAPASRCGLGWNLSAGGSITRVVCGLPDETLHKGNLNAGGVSKVPGGWPSVWNMQAIFKGDQDGEYDYYILQIPGQSLKFYYDGTGCFTMPASGFKIEKGGFLGADNAFKVTSPEGVIYYFTLVEMMDFSNDKINMVFTDRVNKWLLTKIVLTNQSHINFFYKPRHEYWVMAGINEWAIDVIYPSYFKGKLDNGITIYGTPSSFALGTKPNGTVYSRKQIWYKYKVYLLDRIESDFGSIHFEYQNNSRLDLPGDYALKSVYKVNFNQVVESRCNLFHNTTRSRLLLDSLQWVFNEVNVLPSTYFTYNPVNLPEAGHTIQDQFGFFADFPVVNANNSNWNWTGPTALPKYSYSWIYNEVLDGIEPMPNELKSQAMMLIAVQYPSGGKKEFFYEINTFNRPVGNGTAFNAGNGLRVKLIKEMDGAGKINYRRISYENGVCLLNTRKHIFTFFGVAVFSQNYPYAYDYCEEKNQKLLFRNATPMKTSPAIFPDEVYYGKVTIESTDEAGNNLNGKVVKEFFAEQLKYMKTPTGFPPNLNYKDQGICVSRAHYYGLPLKTTFYKKEGQVFLPIKETSYAYNFYCNPLNSVNNFYARPIQPYVKDGQIPRFLDKDDWYYHSSGTVGPHSLGYFSEPFHLDTITTKEWGTHGNGFVLKRQVFLYETPSMTYVPKHFMPIKIVQQQSTENIITTYINRVAAYNTGATVHPQAAAINAMKASNQWGTEVERYSILNEGTPNAVLLSASLREFEVESGLPALSIPKKQYELKKGVSVANFSPATFAGNAWQRHAAYTCVQEVKCLDARKNVISVESKKQSSTLLNAPLADLQMAEVQDALDTEIAYASFEWYEPKNIPIIAGTPRTAFGNWLLQHPAAAVPYSTDVLFGNRSLALSAGVSLTTAATCQLVPGKKYFLSVWTKGASPQVTYGGTLLEPKVLTSRQGWTLLEYVFTASNASLNLSGNCLIDEPRLGPLESSWAITIYDAYARPIATGTDINDYLFTTYDALGRPYRTKDLEGNILKQNEYHIQINQN